MAFTGSVVATFSHHGKVYYESVAMFIFLLLRTRYLELIARRESLAAILRTGKSIPELATSGQ